MSGAVSSCVARKFKSSTDIYNSRGKEQHYNKNDYSRISLDHNIPFGDSQDIISFHLIVLL